MPGVVGTWIKGGGHVDTEADMVWGKKGWFNAFGRLEVVWKGPALCKKGCNVSPVIGRVKNGIRDK